MIRFPQMSSKQAGYLVQGGLSIILPTEWLRAEMDLFSWFLHFWKLLPTCRPCLCAFWILLFSIVPFLENLPTSFFSVLTHPFSKFSHHPWCEIFFYSLWTLIVPIWGFCTTRLSPLAHDGLDGSGLLQVYSFLSPARFLDAEITSYPAPLVPVDLSIS